MDLQLATTAAWGTALRRNYPELVLLAWLGFQDTPLTKASAIVFLLAVSDSHLTSKRLRHSLVQLAAVLSLLLAGASCCLAFFLFLFTQFCRSGKMRDRPPVEKAFLAFIVTDGVFHPPEFPIYAHGLTAFLLYCLASSCFPENSFKRFVATNLIFGGTIAFYFVAYWGFIVFMVRVKLALLLTVSAKIVFGVLLVSLAKRLIRTRNIVVRKYFHFLAFFLFASMIVDEVASSAPNHHVLFHQRPLFGRPPRKQPRHFQPRF